MRRLKIILFFCFLMELLVVPGLAGDEKKSAVALGEIVVTGKRVAEKPYVQDVVSAESLERPVASGSVLDALDGQAGVQLRRSGLAGTKSSNLRIRGFDETRLRILADGVSIQRDGFYGNGQVDWGALSPEAVERIEIHRGAGPARFGNTLGGVVNIVSKQARAEPKTVISSSAGSLGTWDHRIAHSARKGPVGWSLAAGKFESDGFLRNHFSDRQNFSGRFTVDLPNRFQIGAGLSYSDQDTGMAVYNRPDSPFFDPGQPVADEKALGGPGLGGRLAAGPGAELACFTNAGFARYRGQPARVLYDVIAAHSPASMGKGNLLAVHSRPDEPLWLAFVHRRGPANLPLVYVTLEDDKVRVSQLVNIHVGRHQSFEPFRAVLGRRVFSIVTLANGWASRMPPDLLAGACFHDHFCCGVATGYFTAKFITEKLPLAKGERYAYVGAPAWCQDDYLLYYLNLTPGKHGYYTMGYPWHRDWNTDQGRFKNLGGIVIRFNQKTGRGRADLLSFDWRWEKFQKFLDAPDLKLDWKNEPWLHVWYNRYLFQGTDTDRKLVSVVRSRPLESRANRDALIRMGANPLEVLLGRDINW